MLLTFDRDLAAGILAEENLIAGPHVRRHQLASLGHLPLTHRYNLALLRFFLRGIGDDNAALGLVFFLYPVHQNAIIQRPDFHETAVASLCRFSNPTHRERPSAPLIPAFRPSR